MDTQVEIVLRDHLRFLTEQNQQPPATRRSLYFEDTALCCRSPFFSCRSSRCGLIHFVPEELRDEAAPCRYIQLTESGDTLQTLYTSGEPQETEVAVKDWLVSTIAKLDSRRMRERKAA